MNRKTLSRYAALAAASLLITQGSTVVSDANAAELPRVVVFAAQPHASEEGPEPGVMLVLRIGSPADALDVHYSIGGTAVNEIDYQPLHGVVTIPAGDWFAPIIVTPIDDALAEERESVVVELEPGTNDNGERVYGVAWPGRAVVGIADNDSTVNHPPSVELVSPRHGAVLRGPLDLRLAARAFDRDGRVVSVEFFAGDTSLGVVPNQPPVVDPSLILTEIANIADLEQPDHLPDFVAGARGLVSDAVADILPRHLFHLVWSNAPPGEHALTAVARDNRGATTRSQPVGIFIVEEGGQPIVSVIARDPIASEGPSASGEINTASFAIHRTGATDFPVDVFFALAGHADNGVDYRETPTRVTIARGERVAQVVIAPIDDQEVEGRENVVLELLPPVCIEIEPPPADCYIVGRRGRAEVFIRDNDHPDVNHPPVVRLVRPLDGSLHRAGSDITIVAQARDRDGRVVSVEFFANDRSLGVVTAPAPAATGTPNDSLTLLPPFHLVWSDVPAGAYTLSAVATDDDGASTHSPPVEIKVHERTRPPVVSIVTTDPVAAEPTPRIASGDSTIRTAGVVAPEVLNTATFRVSRTGPTDADLRVFYRLGGSAENGVDYHELSGHATIPSGREAVEIVVAPLDDSLVEGRESVVATLVSPVALATDAQPLHLYVVGPHSRARAVIEDNDSNGGNRPPRVVLRRPGDGARFRAGSDIKLVADARDHDGSVTSVEFFANGHSLGVVRSADAVSLLPDQSEAARLEERTLKNDHLYRLLWSDAPAGVFSLTAVATDDDGATTVSEANTIRVIVADRQIVTVRAHDPRASEGGGVAAPNDVASDLDTATFVISRRGSLDIELPVFYALGGSARNGVDYVELSGETVIPVGQESVRVTIAPVDDEVVERLESVVIEIRPPVCPAIEPPPAICYLVGEPGRAVAHIADNDSDRNHAPRVVIVAPRTGTRFVAPAEIEIVTHARDRDGWVTQMEFFAGDHKIGESVVHFIQAPEPGQRQVFALTWSNAVAGSYVLRARATDNLGASATSEPVSIVVRDHASPPVVNIVARDAFASEAPLASGEINRAVFVIKRDGPVEAPLTVAYRIGGTADNGVDYQTLSGMAVIPADARSVVIEVTPIDDSLAERRETVTLSLAFPVSSSQGQGPLTQTTDGDVLKPYEIGRHRRAGAVIVDNDRPVDPNERVDFARRAEDGVVMMTLTGPEGAEGVIEASVNLVDWFPVGNAVVVDGVIHIVDAEAGEKEFQFYRVVSSNENVQRARNF